MNSQYKTRSNASYLSFDNTYTYPADKMILFNSFSVNLFATTESADGSGFIATDSTTSPYDEMFCKINSGDKI